MAARVSGIYLSLAILRNISEWELLRQSWVTWTPPVNLHARPWVCTTATAATQACLFRKWVFWRQGLTSDLQSSHEAKAPHILSGPDWFYINTKNDHFENNWTLPGNVGKFLSITSELGIRCWGEGGGGVASIPYSGAVLQKVCMWAFVRSTRLLVMWGLLFTGHWALHEIYFLLCAFGCVHVHMYVGTHGKQKKLRCLTSGDGARSDYELPDVDDQNRILVLCESISLAHYQLFK